MKTIVLVSLLIVKILALDNGVARLPPMGWNTWCTDDPIPCESDFCEEKEIMDIATAMATNGMKDVGYQYIILDDCWAGPRDSNGDLTADPTRFPSGMKALADFVHSKGLLFGLYTCAGNLTCKFNRPGSWGHFQQDADTFASWGIDYVKMDWCFHPDLAPSVVYPMMTEALNKTGRPIHFNLCEWGEEDPWLWAQPVGNSWRVGPDHMPFWYLPDTQQGTSDIIENMAGKSPYAGPGGWNDPDFLMTGIWTMTHLESMTEFSFWALFAAPLIVTTDIRDMSNKKDILLNTEVIAVNQDPLGIAGDRIANYTSGGQIWSKPLSDGSYAVILYNRNWIESVTLTVNWSDVFDGETGLTVTVRDLWKHAVLGQYTNSFTATVEGHGVVMIKCTPVA